jgi:hypothetical protein
MHHINNLGNVVQTGHHFAKYSDPSGYNEEMGEYVFNPPTFLVGVDLQFRFHGLVDQTHLTIHIIRQKKMVTSFYDQAHTSNFLPNTLDKLDQIAGFSVHELDRKVFEVIQSRKVYINSKGEANVADLANNTYTSQPTTRSTVHKHMYIPFNKTLKPCDPSTYDETGLRMYKHGDPFKYDKMHPLANVWCLISCDDQSALGTNIGLGDGVHVEIIRKCIWRDPLQ